jgi:hypothetical protein
MVNHSIHLHAAALAKIIISVRPGFLLIWKSYLKSMSRKGNLCYNTFMICRPQ